MKVPPPLPVTEPPPLDSTLDDAVESNLSNPLFVPVATERLLVSSASGNCISDAATAATADAGESFALPAALEQSIRIKKGGDPLGISVEMVDAGMNGVMVTSITRGGAVHRDGRIRAGDYLISVNHETMRFATNAQARAILRRTQLVSTDVR